MEKTIFLLVIICSILLTGCKEGAKVQTAQAQKQIFHLPEIPTALTDPQERAEYLTEHYWDHFAFTDTSLIHKPETIEPVFADFIGVLPHATYPVVNKGIRKLMKKAEVNIQLYIYLGKLADKYLYDSNSPMRNEDFYIHFLKSIVESKMVDETHKIRFRHQLAMVLKNLPGSIATNFVYTLASGKSGKLSDINSQYTLLFFNNPDCELCGEIREQIIASPILSNLQSMKSNQREKLTVLSVYTEEELAIWREQQWKNPSIWVCGYDKKQKIRNQKLYDLKSIPTLYLLDREKRILLKDTSLEAVEHYLEN